MQYVVYCLRIISRKTHFTLFAKKSKRFGPGSLEIMQVFFLDNSRRPGILMKFCGFFKRKDVTKSSY